MSYKLLTTLKKNKLDLRSKRVLILGAGYMAKEYCKALSEIGLNDVTVISRSETSARGCASPYGFQYKHGGYAQETDLNLALCDLAIIALPMHELKSAADYLAKRGVKNILVEKPGSLYSADLNQWAEEYNAYNVRLRLAYNRLLYPNLWKLKELVAEDGGITSCRYTFTEWIHTIIFDKETKEAYERWGISNSLHVISMAHDLIGLPKNINTTQFGSLSWHPTGSRFVGSGITEFDIPFSYHADWDSAGRWSIEIMTKENAYSLTPLEDLYKCKKGSVQWNKIDFEKSFPGCKQGIAEEIVLMLRPDLEEIISLPSLNLASKFNRLAEDIFGYSKRGSN